MTSSSNTGRAPTLRELLDSGRPMVGSICAFSNALTAEVMARAGFDWLFLDMQHGLGNHETVVDMIRALDITGTPALVRAAWNRPELVGWALDAGAQCVVSPMISNAQQARDLVAACRFAAPGVRSWGPIRASLRRSDYGPAVADSEAIVCAMLETAEAMANLEQILDVDGLDLVLIGQSDLSISFGLHPSTQRGDAAHKARLKRIAEQCARRNVQAIINCTNNVDGAELRAMGFKHLMVDSDLGLLKRGANAVCAQIKAL
jgi:4-hydroxy-2-oxoheptanedioate aldolase